MYKVGQKIMHDLNSFFHLFISMLYLTNIIFLPLPFIKQRIIYILKNIYSFKYEYLFENEITIRNGGTKQFFEKNLESFKNE